MLIERIRATNYKTYKTLDLDLSVKPERPIVLIGGHNGDGKTTLFEAIYGALYGLSIASRTQFLELVNANVQTAENAKIELEITFTGQVLSQTQKYILRRTYELNPESRPIESVMLNMNGTFLRYGSAFPARQSTENEQAVSKIISANLPEKLSRYFLFDAMQSSDLLKENVFAQIIRDNIENVMGFSKYVELRKAAESLQQEMSAERIKIAEQKKAYENHCLEMNSAKKELGNVELQKERIMEYLQSIQSAYEDAKSGERNNNVTQTKINALNTQIENAIKEARRYHSEISDFVDKVETYAFFPKLADAMRLEIKSILAARGEQTSGKNISSEAKLEVIKSVVEYLKEIKAISSEISLDEILQNLAQREEESGNALPYAYLNDVDIDTLRKLLSNGTLNPFARLDSDLQTRNAELANLESWKKQRSTLENQLTNGNDSLIHNYENENAKLKKLEQSETDLRSKIAELEKKIHQIDVAIQREPDIKYDTLTKLPDLLRDTADTLLKRKRKQIESEMKALLNKLILPYKDHIAKVELSEELENFSIKLYHKAGNEISLSQLNAASKQIFIQILLRVLRNLGDYNPPVMIDTVMGVLDNESRDVLMEEYFPSLAEQTILLCTDSEIRTDSDYKRLEAWISKSYTLNRDVEQQCTEIGNGYFGIDLKEEE